MANLFWAHVVDHDGDETLLGPFNMEEQAELECDLKRVRVMRFVQADSRQAALAKVRGVRRKRGSLLQTDEPALQPMGSFVSPDAEEDDDDV